MPQLLQLHIAARTDAGMVRTHNEDAVACDAEYGVVVLADGMGGYNAGEVASRMATEIVLARLVKRLRALKEGGRASTGLCDLMTASVQEANRQILEAATTEPDYRGMGTTLVAGLFQHDRLVLAHLGDSRCYRQRHGQLQQLTHDHSSVQEQIDNGMIDSRQARYASDRHLITRALGVQADIMIDASEYPLSEGDLYLFCSDGLTDMLDVAALSAMLSVDDNDLELLAEALILLANQQGGRDNISVIIVKVAACAAPQHTLARFKNWLPW